MSSEWERCTLGDILTLQRGMDLPLQDRKSGKVPIVASNGIAGYHDQASVKAPGVVIGRSGSIGGGQYIESDFWPLNTTLWVKDFKGNDPRYCYYLLRSIDFSGLNAGSGVPTLNRNHLHPMPMVRPPLKVQKDISTLLGLLDDRINLLRETNSTLEAIAQALFKSWFVDFDPVRAKQKGCAPEGMNEETAALFPDSFHESELGLVPKGWRVGVLRELLLLRNERTKPTSLTASLPYVPVESITAKSPFLQEFKSGEEANSSLILFHKGDILFGAMRPYFHKVCSAPFSGVTRTTVFTLIPKNTNAAAFALFQCYQDSTVEYATQHSEGSTIPYAKWNNSLEKMPVILPSDELQKKFSVIVSEFIERANENIRQIQTLTNLRDTLLPYLISGKIRLPDIQANLE